MAKLSAAGSHDSVTLEACKARPFTTGADGEKDMSSPTLVTPGMPIHDAIALTRFLMDATIGYVRFRVDLQPKTVGGPVDMAVITRHEGFRWVQRKKLSGPSAGR